MTAEESRINFAVMGWGHIGRRHAEMIVRHPGAALVAAIDIRSRAELKIDTPGLPLFPTINDFLSEGPSADIMSIATPNGLHATHAITALEAGKHVIIEKPIALHAADAQAIIRKAKEAGRKAMVVMQVRYAPAAQWVKEMVSSGRLGRIYLVQVNCYWNRDDRYYKKGGWHGTKQLDGGTLFTQFSHFVDLLVWLFGDLSDIKTRFRNNNHQELTHFEDSGILSFDLENAGMGSFNFSTSVWDRNMESCLSIIGEHGTVKLSGQSMETVDYCHVKDYDFPGLSPAIPAGTNEPQPYHYFVINDMVDWVKGRTHTNTTALEALKVVEVIERMYAGSAH